MNLSFHRAGVWILVLLIAGCAAWRGPSQRSLRDLVVAAPGHAAAHTVALAQTVGATRDGSALLRLLGGQQPAVSRGAASVSAAAILDPFEGCRLGELPPVARSALSDLFRAITTAEGLRRHALRGVPAAALAPQALMTQLTAPQAREAALLDTVAATIDPSTLAEGMSVLLSAVDRFAAQAALSPWPPLRWRCDTPLGAVVIDTTGADDEHRLVNPLFVFDSGGNDRYLFAQREDRNRIAIVLDASGNDRYEAVQAGADASAGLLGYGLVRDLKGNDTYTAGWLGQGAALGGIGWLQDDAGDDRYAARGFSQAFALAGIAVLADARGNDRYEALTYAQASAMTAGVAALIDRAGDDGYQLSGQPLVLPSAQLADRNASMGQGAGRGSAADGVADGLGLLFDLSGRDSYRAEVFAQGVGYGGGMGLLFDAEGGDTYEAAWYAMGAAAHGGIGVLVDAGGGGDRYTATHSTALAAAHDRSLGVFHDAGGDDRYQLGTFGLGAASDDSEAWFSDLAGRDVYQVTHACIAFGATLGSPPSRASFRASSQATGASCSVR